MPVPPAAAAPSLVPAKMRSRHRSLPGDMVEDAVKKRLVAIREPALPACAQRLGIAGEAVPPMRKGLDGQGRRVMGPVLPQLPVALQQRFERLGPVALAPAEQDHVMRAFHRRDAVDLNEADPLNQCGERGAGGGASRRVSKGMPVEEQLAGEHIGKNGEGHALGLSGRGPRSTLRGSWPWPTSWRRSRRIWRR